MENTRTTTTTTAGNMSRHEGTNESHDGLNHLQARLSGSKAYATNNTCNSSSNSSASAASSSAPPSPTVSTKLLQVVSTSGHNNNNSKEESSNTNNNAKSNTNFGDQKWHEMYQRLVKYKQVCMYCMSSFMSSTDVYWRDCTLARLIESTSLWFGFLFVFL